MIGGRRAIAISTLVCCAAAAAGCGDDKTSPADRFGAIPKRTIVAPDDLTAPRWQQLAEVRGSSRASRKVHVSGAALQWRARWRCRSGEIVLTATPPPPRSDGRAGGRCPGRGSVTWVGSGAHTVGVRASARFRVIVEEELRTPLHEPAPAAVASKTARELARGRFEPVELKGRGSAVVYRLPGGKLVVRMEDFATEPNPELEVWLSAAADASTSRRVFAARHTKLRSLKATIGDQNYTVPAGVDAADMRSVVVVNAAQRIAYAAATIAR